MSGNHCRAISCPRLTFFLILDCEAIVTAATPRVIVKMIMEKQMECRLAGETQVLGENVSQRQFCPSQNPTWPDPSLNPGRRGGKPATNRLSYCAAEINPCFLCREDGWRRLWQLCPCPLIEIVFGKSVMNRSIFWNTYAIKLIKLFLCLTN
jgi:hypothetical protein